MKNNSPLKFFLNNKKTIIFISFILLVLFFSFWNLGKPTLESWDEGTNANVVFNSVNKNNPFNLELFGKNFIEKPPLWYYLTYCIVKVFGFNSFSLRFVSAISGFLIIMLVFKICNDRYGFKNALVSGFIMLCTQQLYFSNLGIFATHHIRSADLDMLQILFIMLSFYFLWQKLNNKNLLLAGTFSGLAVFTKGPIGLLPIILLLMYNYIHNKSSLLKIILLTTVPIFLINAPWFLVMFIKSGNGFVSQFFGYHIIERSILPVEGNAQSIFFYFQILLNPRFFFSGILLIVALENLYKQNLTKKFCYFSIFWGIIGLFLFITFIPTKLSWYILPIYPLASISISNLIYNNKTSIKFYKFFNFSVKCNNLLMNTSKKYIQQTSTLLLIIFNFLFIIFHLIYLVYLPGHNNLNLQIGKIFYVVVLIISILTFFILRSHFRFVLLIILCILPISIINILDPDGSDLESIVHSNYLQNKNFEYVYSEEIDRSDWFYLTVNNISYINKDNVQPNSLLIVSRKTAGTLERENRLLKIDYSQGEYYVIEIK